MPGRGQDLNVHRRTGAARRDLEIAQHESNLCQNIRIAFLAEGCWNFSPLKSNKPTERRACQKKGGPAGRGQNGPSVITSKVGWERLS